MLWGKGQPRVANPWGCQNDEVEGEEREWKEREVEGEVVTKILSRRKVDGSQAGDNTIPPYIFLFYLANHRWHH